MKKRRGLKPLHNITLGITLFIFLILLTVMTLQGLLMYLYLRILYRADVPIPQFWRPIPLLLLTSLLAGVALTVIASRVPLKPVRQLIAAINELADGNFHVRIHLDLTQEFVKLSESFNRMAQELENTELLRSDFINNFSHEFKTPIVSLRGFAKILKSDTLTREERDEYLDIIISESNVSAFELSEEIRQAILLLETKWQKKELEWILELDEIVYSGNKDLLNQMWINLIDNAVKFSPQGGKVKIKLHADGPQVRFQIWDNGCGMDQEIIDHIFDRFYQGDLSHTAEGNGIGLTVVKRIAELHGGSVSVYSEPGIGTNFKVILPVQP